MYYDWLRASALKLLAVKSVPIISAAGAGAPDGVPPGIEALPIQENIREGKAPERSKRLSFSLGMVTTPEYLFNLVRKQQ